MFMFMRLYILFGEILFDEVMLHYLKINYFFNYSCTDNHIFHRIEILYFILPSFERILFDVIY